MKSNTMAKSWPSNQETVKGGEYQKTIESSMDHPSKELLEPYLSGIIETIKSDKITIHSSKTRVSAEKLFDTYMSHDFIYLSRKQATPYKDPIIKAFRAATKKKIPLPMYLDLGPGYHAALENQDPRKLSFDIGLGELLVLYQFKKFSDRISEIYAPGVSFGIIIDNICAVFVNDISIKNTEAYCHKFNKLITELNMDNQVKLLVESEHFSTSDYHVKPITDAEIKNKILTEDEYKNVKRFLGHECSIEDAARRVLLYAQIGDRTDELFAKFFKDGVHMTQRASKTTISFRPFPGGDSRIQSGKVVLGINKKNKLYPFLLTSRNFNGYDCESFSFPKILPKSVREITFANPRARPASISA